MCNRHRQLWEAVYLVLTSKSEEGDKLRQQSAALNELAEIEDRKEELQSDIEEIKNWISTQPVLDEHEIAKLLSKNYNLNMTKAKEYLESYPKEYLIKEKDIPEIVKDLKKYRRKLKGKDREELTKSIENLINSYSNHLSDCIKSIYWLAPYETPLRQMGYKEKDLKKLHAVKDSSTRRELIDSLCKYWEAELFRGKDYNPNYSNMTKTMTNAKRDFRKIVKNLSNYPIRKTLSEQLDDFILKSVCEHQGITARHLYDKLPAKLHRSASPHIISKVADKLEITNIEGQYYKLPNEIKKDLYAYTAAFIDSDGYITMDRKYNPRIGIIATGDRGKAFVTELHKELGFGKLHLDQKSPQATRSVQRLNFYSYNDVTSLLSKCRPYFRMKGDNADILSELIRIKKNYRKSDWAKDRLQELFKLMKWANHKDHVGYDFSKEGIYVDDIQKYKNNCKMGLMDELDKVEVIAKAEEDDAIDDLEEIVEEYELTPEQWSSVDDASDYLFEHVGPTRGEEE